MDSFWQQDVINDWNDEYSPRKVLHPKQEFNYDGSIPINMTDPSILPKRSPVKQDRITKEAKKSFNKTKYELAESFLLELDTKVTNGEISRLAKLSGGVKILWNKKLNTTAGRANWKRETLKPMLNPTMEDGTMLPRYRHYAYIELAEKIIDDEDRLLNTIAHEFCHLTTFMIDNMKENPHGKEFKVWGAKVTRMFRHRGIEVTTKHSYQIDYKYVWECENCGRRKALMAGAAWMFMCFMVYAFVGSFVLDATNPMATPVAGKVLIVFTCLFIVAFATTWGPLVWAVVGEMYPSRYRAPAMAVATASNWLLNFLISFFTTFITNAIHYFYGLVFGGCCLALFFIVYFFMMETKDRSLEEIDTMYTSGVSPRKSANWKPSDVQVAVENKEAAPEGLMVHDERAFPENLNNSPATVKTQTV